MMRRILVDRARARVTEKRVAPLDCCSWMTSRTSERWRARELMVLDDALTTMAKMDPRKAKVIELRFFGGLSVEETAEVLKLSPQSVMRDWKLAKAWLDRLTTADRSLCSGCWHAASSSLRSGERPCFRVISPLQCPELFPSRARRDLVRLSASDMHHHPLAIVGQPIPSDNNTDYRVRVC